jgi:hypothetical protein
VLRMRSYALCKTIGSAWQEYMMRPRPARSAMRARRVRALFDAQAVYVGKGKSLRQRVWTNHRGKGQSLRSSAFRRNVAEHLGIASANAIETGLYRPTPEEVRRVWEWLERCDVAWATSQTETEAITF